MGTRPACLHGLARTARTHVASVDVIATTREALQEGGGDEVPTVTDPGARVVEFVSYEEGVFTVTGTLQSGAHADTIYGLLTDYPASPRVFHNVNDITVHERATGQPLTVSQVSEVFGAANQARALLN